MAVTAGKRSILPTSLERRGFVLILLVALTASGAAWLAHRTWAEQQALQLSQATEALFTVLLESHLNAQLDAGVNAPDIGSSTQNCPTIVWAGVYDANGQGLEFRRRFSLRREAILEQVPFSATAPTLAPLRIEGDAMERLSLLTVPRQSGGVFAAVVEQSPPEATGLLATYAGPLAICIAGLACALAWLHFSLHRPLRDMNTWACHVQLGRKHTSLSTSAPDELKDLARVIVQTERDLARSHNEIDELRASLETRVDAKIREMRTALSVASREADRDALTGLFNRRAMLRDLPLLFEDAKSGNRDLTVALFDVDHFKQFNDTRGHLAGDQLLAFIGALLRACTRGERDRAVRYGGDEFVVILPDTSLDQAVAMARRIRDLFGQYTRTLKTAESDQLPAVSAGVASLKSHRPVEAKDLLEAADTAMYYAKHTEHGVASPDDVARGNVPPNAARNRRTAASR